MTVTRPSDIQKRDDAPPPLGHNNPPPFDPDRHAALVDEARAFAAAAGEWLDLGQITTEGLRLPDTVGWLYLRGCTLPEGLRLPDTVGSLYLRGSKMPGVVGATAIRARLTRNTAERTA